MGVVNASGRLIMSMAPNGQRLGQIPQPVQNLEAGDLHLVSHEDLRTLYQKGGRAYEQFREQKKVEKLLSMLRE